MAAYHFKNKFTDHYIISTNQDTDGHVVNTVIGKNSAPKDSVLHVRPAITGNISVVAIRGVNNNLYISLEGEHENTKLTWSKHEYLWVVSKTPQGTRFITPASGADLFWVDVFGTGPVVIVRAGRNIQPPQNEWIINEV